MYAAATDGTAVADLSFCCGHQKYGACLVTDFKNDTIELYSHHGYAAIGQTGVTYSTGIVKGYNRLGDYAGDFFEVDASVKGYGGSYCQDPSKPLFSGPRAYCLTFSDPLSSSANSFCGIDAGLSYDYYIAHGSLSFKKRELK